MKKTKLGQALIKAAKEIKEEVSSRHLVIYTPNYGVAPYKVVYDSSRNTNKKTSGVETAQRKYRTYDKRPAEDSETRMFIVYPGLTNDEVLKVFNYIMEIAGPGTMFWTDIGINARKAVDNMREVIDNYDGKVRDIKKYHKYKPKKWARI